jgi:O-antigen/teichoic acid export membrane protein
MGAAIIIFSRPIMSIFGREFEAGWAILTIGTLGQLVNCGTGSVGFLLLMSGNQRRLIKIQAVMALVMVGLNMLFIPRWGILGAALAAAVCCVVSNIWFLGAVHSVLGLFPYNRSYLRLIVPVTATVASLLLLRYSSHYFQNSWLLVAAAIVAGYVVFASTVLVSGLDADDKLIADAVWYKVRGMFQRGGVSA